MIIIIINIIIIIGLECFARRATRLDSGSHFYDTYETSDGRHMAVGAIEPQFYAIFINKLGMEVDQVISCNLLLRIYSDRIPQLFVM